METLCWKCANACGDCSWSKDFKPVKGWKAQKTIIKNFDRITKSFNVIYCPEFVPDKKRKRKIDDEFHEKVNAEVLAKEQGVSIRTIYRRMSKEKLKNCKGE